MSITAHQVHYTYAEYLALESFSDVKHEYLNGQIYGMAGGTPEHAALFTAIAGLLIAQLRGRCRVYSADLRVRTASGLTTYPDVTVACGADQRDAEDTLAVTNPTLIVEVLSPSTEEYDRGSKFEHYKTLESLRQYVLVSQSDRALEIWTRGDDNRWTSTTVRDGAIAQLSIGAKLDVRELYHIATGASA